MVEGLAEKAPEIVDIDEARGWIGAVNECIDSVSAGDALALTLEYDRIYSVAFGCTNHAKDLARYVLTALEALINGDTSVDEYALFQAIDRGVKCGDASYSGHALEWHSAALARWHQQFRYGTPLQPLSPRDTNARVAILLDADLTPLAGPRQHQFKQTLRALHPQTYIN